MTPVLTLDRGNSTLDAMLHPDGRRQRLEPSAAGLAAFLGDARPRRCIAVSVVPDGLAAAAAVLAERAVPMLVAGRDLPCPLRLDYETPATLGADRWLGALAAHRRFGTAVVVDCGSATTVNLVDRTGTFRGGCIAPGLAALLQGMARVTPHLPLADPARGGSLPARSTQAGLDTGVLLAFCGQIERMVADAQAALGEAALVLTGGNAGHYLRAGRLPFAHVPDLVHQGLRCLGESACAS